MGDPACYLPELGLSTGEQIAAARKLLRIDQPGLAKKAGVGLATLRRMEACVGRITAGGKSVGKVAKALEKMGVELIDDRGELGVLLVKRSRRPTGT